MSTAARLVEHAWNEKLGDIGLTHAGVIALDVLAANGPMTQASLAQIVRVQAQTIGKTLMRLEAYGYVVRQRSQSDRRSQVVSITAAGLRHAKTHATWSAQSWQTRTSTPTHCVQNCRRSCAASQPGRERQPMSLNQGIPEARRW